MLVRNDQRPPLNVADSLPDEEIEEEEEEESLEDTPMEDVSRDGSPPHDPLSCVTQAASPNKVSSATLQLLDAHTQLRNDVQFLNDFGEQETARVEPAIVLENLAQIEDVDEPYRTYPPYAPPTPKGDGQGDGPGSDQEGKSEDHPPNENASKTSRRGSTSSLRTPTKRSTPASSGRSSLSKKFVRPANQCLQLRPTDHKRGQVGCRSAIKSLERTVDEACKSLPEFKAWQDIRPDVQVVLRAGLDYPGAL
ncbi:unnamed protein product [Phytophthora fragariaefolia]|uniref:Unnamed protein product n=1 Tax=Phytophthora fragariaefolia TaxID=1490495 RepID=A0A9W6WS52_9STRA|nr:unnamed protein product [Phytophthora fragariaefolia]